MKAFTVSILLAVLAPFGVASADDAGSRFDPPTIRVTGKAEIAFPPDFIEVRAGVTLRGADPSVVHADVRKAAAEMLAFVTSLGIEERDILTDRISVMEVEWGYDSDDCPVTPEEDERFEGGTSFKIALRDFDMYERLIEGLFERGANRLGSVTFKSDQRTEKTREARVAAVRAAKEKASYIAAELGQTLGRPLEVTEAGQPSYSSTMNTYVVETFQAPMVGGSSISAGELKASAGVTVVFELLDAGE